jgi:hypothetical protein
MPRSGQFAGMTHVYGQPLAVVKPPDNNVAKGRYSAELDKFAADHKLTAREKDDLQRQIEELYSVWQMARDEDLV